MYRDGYVGMMLCYHCHPRAHSLPLCALAATLYVYFVDQCHPYIFFISKKSFLYYLYVYQCVLIKVGNIIYNAILEK